MGNLTEKREKLLSDINEEVEKNPMLKAKFQELDELNKAEDEEKHQGLFAAVGKALPLFEDGEPSDEQLQKIADEFGVDLEDLEDGIAAAMEEDDED